MNQSKPNSGESNGEDDAKCDLDDFKDRLLKEFRKPKFVLEVAGLVVLGVYAGFTIAMYFANKKSADAAKSAANTAASQLELAERPWVDASMATDGPFNFVENGVRVPFKFQLLNTGHTPASATRIELRMNSPFSAGPSADQLLAQACSEATQGVLQRPYFGITLFPNRPLEQSQSFAMSNEEIAKLRIPGEITWPNLIVCIAYRSTFADKVYHTGYILALSKVDPATGREDVRFKLRETVDQKNLRFKCSISNCIVAD
jgi:hypothetical protein